MLSAGTAACPSPEAEAFVRFCYQRRRVGWPELYDEMCAVATRGLFRGMGHEALAEIGVGFSLFQTPRLAELVTQIVTDEQAARRAARAAMIEAAEVGAGRTGGERSDAVEPAEVPAQAVESRQQLPAASAAWPSGADAPPRHLALDLALGLDVAIDLLAELVRLGGVEVDLLLEDVRQPPARHAHVVQVLHQDQGVHRGEVGGRVHLLHRRVMLAEA